MANEVEEEIIIIEDVDAANDADAKAGIVEDQDDKKKKLLIFSLLVLVLILLIIVILIIVKASSKPVQPSQDTTLSEQMLEKKPPVVEKSSLENMIAKANYLYSNGDKLKALSLYEQIAHYSQAISMYNLGVSQMKDKQYSQALQTFKKAIANGEKICVSAINAAVCSLYIKDQKSFDYYIDLAYAYLPYEIDSPLYSYYFSLINYYKRNYLEALNTLHNTDSKEYLDIQNNLKAKINALYQNNYDAIDALELNDDEVNDLALGLLYARIGEVNLALSHFNTTLLKEVQQLRAKLALGLVLLKSGQISKATALLQDLRKEFPEQIATLYPVRVELKESLFNPKRAQNNYRESVFTSKEKNYAKIFYFSPYKIFNANQIISFIRKGNASSYIDNVKSAQEYFQQSSVASNINKNMTLAIKKALNFHLREANEAFEKLIEYQPKHSILQYNLALSYAQLGDYYSAHEHFLRSYYLDSKNYLAGIYAVYTAQLTNNKYNKLQSILADSLHHEEDSEEIKLYTTLLSIANSDYLGAENWLDLENKKKPLTIILDTIIATNLKQFKTAKQATEKLVSLLPNDILPHLLYINTHFQTLDDIEFSKQVIPYLKEQNFNYNDLYYGPSIVRDEFVQINLITGQLYYLREQLKKRLSTTSNGSTKEIVSALALASLYDKQFEEAYTLYNNLIDEQKMQDSYTLFLGAIASIAADHHANAIALLELSKKKNRSFYDSRYALGLLYLEVENYEAALIQFSGIDSNKFYSNYFDFEIDTQKLLFQKQHQEQ